MPLTRANTIAIIKQVMDGQSDDPNIKPGQARIAQAEGFGNAIFDAMIGRTVTVNGVTSDGASFTGTGIIIE